MTVYRVEFSKDWITGRWGFTDRVMTGLNGRVTEPSRLENAFPEGAEIARVGS